jgi:Cu/Ag efflux protein CusF
MAWLRDVPLAIAGAAAVGAFALGGPVGRATDRVLGVPSALAEGQRRWSSTGVLREILDGGRAARIQHADIPGFMRAMTMRFETSAPGQLAGLAAGDAVAFEFEIRAGKPVLLRITKR